MRKVGPTQRWHFARDLAALGVSSATGYFFVLLLSPVLTRIYGPADFGLFGVFGAVVAVLSIIAPLGFDQAIVGTVRRPEAIRLSASAVAATIVTIAAAFLLALPAARLLPADIGMSATELILAVMVCALAVFTTVSTNWAVRSGKSALAGLSIFITLAGRSMLQLVFGLAWGGLYGLIAGELGGRLAAYIVIERGMTNKAFRKILRAPLAVVRHARKNSDFPVYIMPATAVDVLLTWAPVPLFTLAYGPVAGGLLVLVQRLGSAPLTIANQSLGQLFHLQAAQTISRSPKTIIRWLLYVVAVSFLVFLALWLLLDRYGEWVFAGLFGQEWGAAGEVALIWAPLFFAQFISLLTNRLILITGRMRIKLVSSLANLVLMTASIPCAKQLGFDFLEAMILMVGMLTVSHFIAILVVLFRTRNFRQEKE